MIWLLKYWRYVLGAFVVLVASYGAYNAGYDRRESIAIKQEQQYQEALQESLRKKYVVENRIVSKYLEGKTKYETRIDTIIERIPSEIPASDCTFPDAAIRLFNEVYIDNAESASRPDEFPREIREN